MDANTQNDGTMAVLDMVSHRLDELDMTKREFARLCGLAPTTLYSLYRPDRRRQRIAPETLIRLANGLGVRPAALTMIASKDYVDDLFTTLLQLWELLPDWGRGQVLRFAQTIVQANDGKYEPDSQLPQVSGDSPVLDHDMRSDDSQRDSDPAPMIPQQPTSLETLQRAQ